MTPLKNSSTPFRPDWACVDPLLCDFVFCVVFAMFVFVMFVLVRFVWVRDAEEGLREVR